MKTLKKAVFELQIFFKNCMAQTFLKLDFNKTVFNVYFKVMNDKKNYKLQL